MSKRPARGPTAAQIKARESAAARRQATARDRSLEAAAAARDRALERLKSDGERLAMLERERHELVARRDRLVDELRAAGLSWGALAAAAGTTRAALIQRRPVPQRDDPGLW